MDIYYYTNAETLFKILKNLRIKFSTLSMSSDLAERMYYHKFLNPSEGIGEEEAIKKVNQYRYICFCKENKSTDFLSKEGASYLNMWDTYANRHKGACIRIDMDMFVHANTFLKYNNITYESKNRYLKRINQIEELLFYKDPIWKNECEIRFLRDPKSNEEHCTIKGCIKNIYLGVDFDKKHERNNVKINNLKQLCDLITQNKDIDPHWFIQPLILENGNLYMPDNGSLLWHRMRQEGISFE